MSRSKPRIRAILSDWGSVVVHFDNRRVAEALASCSDSPLNSVTMHRIMFGDLREVFDVFVRGDISTAGFRAVMYHALRLDGCREEDFDRAFSDVFTPNPPIIDLWKRLRAQGVKLVAASNVEELRHAWLTKMGIHDLFDEHCLSYRIRRGKPEPEFFHELMRLAYISPDEALFVDDKEEFVEVAKSQLINGYTYDINDHGAFVRYLEGFELVPYRIS